MRELLDHPWVKVLLVATCIAMVSFALRETAVITLPILSALSSVLVPVAIGFTVAYIITPLVDQLSRLGVGRFVATSALFAAALIVLAGTVTLVIPSMVRQGSDLVSRSFRGEHFTDGNGNGRWDPGEAFSDQNKNGTWDAAVLTRGLRWLEDYQADARVKSQLALDESALRFIAFYQAETAGRRGYVEAMLLAAGAHQPPEQWPPLPAGAAAAVAPSDAGVAGGSPPPVGPVPIQWEDHWPLATRHQVDDAAMGVGAAHRERWLRLVCLVGEDLADRHALLLAALREERSGATRPPADALAARLREALAKRPTAEVRKAANQFALDQKEAEKRGDPAAQELFAAVSIGDPAMGSQFVQKAIERVDAGVRASLDRAPGKLGEFAQTGLSSFDAVLSFGLSVLLVPIYAFFLTLAMPQVRAAVKTYIPIKRRNQIVALMREIEKVVSAFFRGRLIISVVCALIGCIGFLALGLFGMKVPYAVFFGIMIGFSTVIPLAGLLFLIPAVVMAMLEPDASAVTAISVVGVYVIVQGAEAVLIPLVMGREVELHPVTLIIALLLCGKLFGVLGLILAVPIFATARILAREYLWPRLRRWAAQGVEAVQPPVDVADR